MIVKRIVSLLGGAILLSSISSIEKFSTRAAPVSVEDFHIDIADLSVDCDNTSGSSTCSSAN
jgi:hypothetical protein